MNPTHSILNRSKNHEDIYCTYIKKIDIQYKGIERISQYS